MMRIPVILFSMVGLAWASTAHAEGRFLFDLLKMPAYSDSFHKMVAPVTKREKWLAVKIPTGPGGESKIVTVAGRRYEFVDTCKQHDCGDNRMFILFSEGGATAVSLLRQPKRDTFLGDPNAPQRTLLLDAAK